MILNAIIAESMGYSEQHDEEGMRHWTREGFFVVLLSDSIKPGLATTAQMYTTPFAAMSHMYSKTVL